MGGGNKLSPGNYDSRYSDISFVRKRQTVSQAATVPPLSSNVITHTRRFNGDASFFPEEKKGIRPVRTVN